MKADHVRIVPLGNGAAIEDAYREAGGKLTLAELLAHGPALLLEEVSEARMHRRANAEFAPFDDISASTAMYRPPGVALRALETEPAREDHDDGAAESVEDEPVPAAAPSPEAPSVVDEVVVEPAKVVARPATITPRDAAITAYGVEIDHVASLLRAGLTVLVVCEKLIVDHIWRAMARKAGLRAKLLDLPEGDDKGPIPRNMRQRQLARLRELCAALKTGDVLVIPHLDLLAGGPDSGLAPEARELIELLYPSSDATTEPAKGPLILAFADPSLNLPEVLTARFSVQLEIAGCPRTVDAGQLLGDAVVTRDEADRFRHFDSNELYKHVAGMNAVRLREAMDYAFKSCPAGDDPTMDDLRERLRAFKAQTSSTFEVPNVKWEDIGGYDDVKRRLEEAIALITGAYNVPESLRSELIPRGFIFHGPPGTGKTLFAKAIANKLQANVQVVSGPEVTDMYVGESERKVRELFAEARRNSPAVLVFDEFDAIAQKRSGREDGGSRAGNAMVAQILTEMDGFRPEPLVLVIGTTNRIDIIDPALMRPSRFASINIGLPDNDARMKIADVHAKNFGLFAIPDHGAVLPELIKLVVAATNDRNGDEIRSIFRDACVAWHCRQEPPDAYNIGRIVGALQRAARERSVEGR